MNEKLLDFNVIAQELGSSFGVDLPVYAPYSLKDDYDLSEATYNVAFTSNSEIDRLSQFGTPVLGSFIIAGGKYLVYDKVTGILGRKEYSSF